MLVGVLVLPLYIKYMGAEAYGLVGFFTMLQAWFNLLDLGLTPTIGRETARFRAGALTALAFRQLFRALSVIFIGVALLGGGSLLLLSSLIGSSWLKAETLSSFEIETALEIMAVSVALRWIGGLYRGVITGSERLVWLSNFNAVIATLRFLVVLPVMWYFGFTPVIFFFYQLMIALIEVVGLWGKTYHLLPLLRPGDHPIGWSFAPIKPVLKFSLTIAFTSAVWVLVTQTDKLVLSGILPLAEYGYFTLAVLVAGGIMIVSGPVSNAIMPRMAKLHTEGKHAEFIQVYRGATQLVSIVAGSATVTLAYCAEPLLFAWTGDTQLSAKAAPILRLYAIGNGFLAIGAFPYYLQYAKGNLRYHLLGNAGLIVVLLPCIVLAAQNFGSIGAGYVWLVINGLYLIIWVGFVHHKLEPGLHNIWVIKDIIRIIIPPVILVWMVSKFNLMSTDRLANFGYVVGIGCVTIFCSFLCSGFLTNINKKIIKKSKNERIHQI